MEEISVQIDGTQYQAPKGSTILDIARANGVDIPTLCHDPRLEPYGACRLCLVEVEGARGLLPACYAKADDGMVIQTATEQLERIRKTLIELIMSDHPKGCMGCDESGSCELQKLARRYEVEGGAEESAFKGETHEYPINCENPFVTRDYNKCIDCGRCIRICREVQGVGVYDFLYRGFNEVPGTPYDRPMQETPCEFCGQCVSTCPTGAIQARPTESTRRTWKRDMLHAACEYYGCGVDDLMAALGLQDWKVRTTCTYCGCGCQIDLHVVDGQVIEVTSPIMVGSGQGNLCVKGRFGYEFIASDQRLTTPLIKKDGEFVEASWDEALDLVASKFAAAKQQSGPDSLAVLSSARCTNEENYAIAKFARAVVGTNNLDHCARL